MTADFEYVLPQTGQYVLALGIANLVTPGPYSFKLTTPAAPTNSLTLGATVTGALAVPGQEDRYTFYGTAGQRIYYYALENDFGPVNVYLYDPLGNNVSIANNADSDLGPFSLVGDGKYTLLIKAAGDAVGTYSFRLLDLAQSPVTALTLDSTVTGTLNPGLRGDFYRFTGTNGQRIFFDFAPTNGSGTWYLFNPLNQYVFGVGLTGDAEYRLPLSGTYLLFISSSATDAVPYSFRATTPATVTIPLVFGTSYTNTYTKAGEEHRYTFSGLVGQRLYYDALQNDFDNSSAQLFDSYGNLVGVNQNSDSDSSVFTLPNTGTYTLVQKATVDTLGSYYFRLLDLAGAPAVTYGATMAGSLNPQLKTCLYRPNGLAGQRIGITNLTASTPNANWYLYNSIDGLIVAAGIGSNLGEVLLNYSGTYELVVIGNSSASGSLDYSFRVNLISSPTGSSSGFGVLQSGTTVSGQTNVSTYTAAAGTVVMLDLLTNTAPANYQLKDPNGNDVFYVGNNSPDSGTYVLPLSGTYTLNILGIGSGDYSLRLLDLNSNSTALTFGTTYSQTATPSWRTDVYRFTGTNGQRLGYDAEMGPTTYYNFITRLISPSNRGVNGGPANNYAGVDYGPFTLTESGTYYLIVEGYYSTETNYTFRLYDATQAPVLSLGGFAGTNLFPVPAGWLTVTGSYVNTSLRGVDQLDWRTNQTIAGTRVDAQINFGQTNWGYLTNVGLTGGSDDNWENFSVQWDGVIRITNANPRLYTRSDDGSRMWIDANSNGLFEASELVNDNWGTGQAATLGPASVALVPGTYAIRIQYEEGTGGNEMYLLADSGVSLDPYGSTVYRFTGTAGQHLFFDSLNPYIGGAGNWYLFRPNNEVITYNNLGSDFETTLTQDGTYLLGLSDTIGTGASYAIHLVNPPSTTNSLSFGTIYSNFLAQPGQSDYYTFNGTSGQRIFYDALDVYNDQVNAFLYTPSGANVNIGGNARTDVGPFALTETGIYTLLLKPAIDYTNNYKFRLLDVAAAPVISYDTIITNNITNGFGVAVYQVPATNNLHLIFDGLGAGDSSAGYYLFNFLNQYLGSVYLGNDLEITAGSTNNLAFFVSSFVSNSVPYSFRVVPGNHPPVLTAIGNKTVVEENTLAFTAVASDLEVPNDVLTFTLDAGAPAGAVINPTTGAFSWTPTEAQGPGTYSVTVRVTDDGIPNRSEEH